MESLVLTGEPLSLEDAYSVVYGNRKVEIAPEAAERVRQARQVLFDMAAEGKPVYGLNRGVGWNKDKEFDEAFFAQYNRNLLNSHCLGIPLTTQMIRYGPSCSCGSRKSLQAIPVFLWNCWTITGIS